MKIDEAESIAKRRIQEFAEPKKELVSANKDRFVLHSWKADDAWYIAVSIFPKRAMLAKPNDDRSENRAVDWLVVRVARNGETQVEETYRLEDLLSA